MSSAATRLSKELSEVGRDDATSGVKAVPVTPDNLRVLVGTIKGPEGTPYEGGIFQIDIDIPKQYPFEPPKMKFHTKIWHPNISSQTGAICLVRSARATTIGPCLRKSQHRCWPSSFSFVAFCKFAFFRTFSKTNGRLRSPSKRRCFLSRLCFVLQNRRIRRMRKLPKCTWMTARTLTKQPSFGLKRMPRKRIKKKPLRVFVIWALIESRQSELSKSMVGTRVLRSMSSSEEYSDFEK